MGNSVPTDKEREVVWQALMREANRFGNDDAPEGRLALYVAKRRAGMSHKDALDRALNASVDEVRPFGIAAR